MIVKDLVKLYGTSITIGIYYSVDDLVDRVILEKELKIKGLSVKFEKGELDGIMSIKFDTIPKCSLLQILSQLKCLLDEPLKKALKNKDKKTQIISALKQTEYLKNFIRLAQKIAKDIQVGSVNLSVIKQDIEKHRSVLGEMGVKLLLKVFTEQDTNKIVNNYAVFQELIINKFAYELFISQQLEHSFLLIIFVDNKYIKQYGNYCKFFLDIDCLNDLKFNKVLWNIQTIGKTVELFVEENIGNIILFERIDNLPQSRAFVIWLKLVFLNATSGLRLMDYSLTQEKIIWAKEIDALPYNISDMKNKLLSYDIQQTRNLIDRLVLMIETSSSYGKEMVLPMKFAISELRPKERKLDLQIINRYMTKRHKGANGLEVGVTRLNPPAVLNFKLPFVLIKDIYSKLKFEEEFLERYQKTLRDLVKEAKDIHYQKELRYKNVKLYNERILTEKINRFTDQIPRLSKILKDWLKPGG